MDKLMSREGRKCFGSAALAAVPLLVAYGVISDATAPLWIAAIAAILAPTLALHLLLTSRLLART